MPQPTTTGGALMGYASTVDTGQPVPAALYTGDLAAGAATTGNTNRCYLVQTYLPTNAILTAIRVRFSSGGAGHYDLGIYDTSAGLPNNLLVHSGSTATASNVQTYTLTTPLPLSPGNYWLAFWIDNATDTFTQETGIASMVPLYTGTNASALPSTAAGLTAGANGTVIPHLLGLFSGGWS